MKKNSGGSMPGGGSNVVRTIGRYSGVSDLRGLSDLDLERISGRRKNHATDAVAVHTAREAAHEKKNEEPGFASSALFEDCPGGRGRK